MGVRRFISIMLGTCLCVASLFAVPKNADQPLPPGPMPKDRPSVALVLAGGGAKGFAHLPVIELIEEVGIPIDMVVGTSIGSVIGGLYAAGYSTKEILNGFDDVDWTPIFRDGAKSPYENTLENYSLNQNLLSLNFGLDFSLKMGTGLSGGQNVYQLLKNMTLKYPSNTDFNELNIPFRAVVTDMLTGEALVIDEGDLAEAIRASMSLPSIFEPAEIDGYYFMDGGIRYNLAINVAKNMGYDIIIAVDISQKVRDNPDVYSSNPAVAMLNTITISQYTATQAMYKDADLVIIPDISKYGTLDFKKAENIYNEGKSIQAEYEPKLEEIRKKIYPQDYDENGNRISVKEEVKKRGIYRKRPNLIPTELNIQGALEQDKKFINKAFDNIFDEELTPETFEEFMELIYLTGNYTSVRPRVYESNEETILELILKQKEKQETKVLMDADFMQTVAPTMMTILNLNLQFQMRGLTGPGSVLALSGTAVNDFGIELFYMQPFNPYVYVAGQVKYLDKRYPQMPLNLDNYKFLNTEFSTFRNMDANLCLGFRTNNGNLIRLEGYYYYRKSSAIERLYDGLTYYVDNDEYCALDEEYKPIAETWDPVYMNQWNEYVNNSHNGISAKSFGVMLEYEFNHLNRNTFAHKGILVHTLADLQFVYDTEVHDPALCLSLDLKGAIPIGKHLSINTSLFAGADVMGNIAKDIPLKFVAGFSRFDRVFFPQYTSEDAVGAAKACAEISLQIEPWSQLTILGGDAFIRINGTFGNVVDNWDQFIPVNRKDRMLTPLIWSASGGLVVKIKDGLDLYLRLGICSNQDLGVRYEINTNPIPFMALDFGSVRF